MKKREVLSAKKITDNKFLNLYELEVRNNEINKTNPYFVASRRKEVNDLSAFNKGEIKPDAVMIVPVMYQDDRWKLILLKQYRPAIDGYIYEFPAGLVDKGEKPIESAIRELKEETGLDCINMKPISLPSFTSVGMSDETIQIFTCRAFGKISYDFKEVNEDIECVAINLEDIPEFITKNPISIKSYLSSLLVINMVVSGDFDIKFKNIIE